MEPRVLLSRRICWWLTLLALETTTALIGLSDVLPPDPHNALGSGGVLTCSLRSGQTRTLPWKTSPQKADSA